jgi:hypothetical protein
MHAHYYLPAGVIALKFLMKITVEQEVNRIEVTKALLAFPIDLTFLSLTFGVAMIVLLQSRPRDSIPTELALLIFVGYIIAALLVTVFSRKSDKAFATDHNLAAVALVFPGYLISVFVMALTLMALGVV